MKRVVFHFLPEVVLNPLHRVLRRSRRPVHGYAVLDGFGAIFGGLHTHVPKRKDLGLVHPRRT